MRILPIEDQQDLSAVVKKGLQEQGYTVDTALDGEEGLFMAENFPLDAIVLDILPPKIDGLALLSRIRKNRGPGLRCGRLPDQTLRLPRSGRKNRNSPAP